MGISRRIPQRQIFSPTAQNETRLQNLRAPHDHLFPIGRFPVLFRSFLRSVVLDGLVVRVLHSLQ